MREIKFRAWDKITKSMCSVVKVVWQFHRWDEIDSVTIYGIKTDGTVERFPHEVELREYTGLKDKNGVEIYEGDVVERRDRVWTLPSEGKQDGNGDRIPIKERSFGLAVGKVKWDGEFAEFVVDLIKGEKGSFYCPDGMTFSYEELEVIGNIHENPDLLGSP